MKQITEVNPGAQKKHYIIDDRSREQPSAYTIRLSVGPVVQTHFQLQQICGELSSLKDEVSEIEAQTVQLRGMQQPLGLRYSPVPAKLIALGCPAHVATTRDVLLSSLYRFVSSEAFSKLGLYPTLSELGQKTQRGDKGRR